MKFTHMDGEGNARMVDISQKRPQLRTAVAEGKVTVSRDTIRLLLEAKLPKGGPIETARLAGIQAAKQTSRLIPLCHDLNLDHIDVEITPGEADFFIRSRVVCRQATGVEMEALTAVSIAALTLYDMCKAVDAHMVIEGIRLVEKVKQEADG